MPTRAPDATLSSPPSSWRRFDPSPLDAGWREHLEFLAGLPRSFAAGFASRWPTSHAGAVELLWLDEREFNAYACTRGRRHWIGIPAAIPCLLQYCFNVVFHVPGLGTAAPEEPPADHPDGLAMALPPDVALAEALATIPGISRPRDDQRATIAATLAEIAAIFCIFHELAHITAGHTGSLTAADGDAQFVELSAGPRRSGGATVQSREIDADALAAAWVLSFVTQDLSTRRHYLAALAIDEESEQDQLVGLVGQVVLAGSILFLYMAQSSRLLQTAGCHPHPMLRNLLLRESIFSLATQGLALERDLLHEEVRFASSLSLVLWAELGLTDSTVPNLNAPEDAVVRAADRLLRRAGRTRRADRAWTWFPDGLWRTPLVSFLGSLPER